MEKYLLDTHALLWYLLDDESLSRKAKEIIAKKSLFLNVLLQNMILNLLNLFRLSTMPLLTDF